MAKKTSSQGSLGDHDHDDSLLHRRRHGIFRRCGENAPAAAAAATATDAAEAKPADAAADSKRFSKEETVYVIADADGTPQKVIVSDWIKNPQKTKPSPTRAI